MRRQTTLARPRIETLERRRLLSADMGVCANDAESTVSSPALTQLISDFQADESPINLTTSTGATAFVPGEEAVIVDPGVEIGHSATEHLGGGRLIVSFAEESRREGDVLSLSSSDRIRIDGDNVFHVREDSFVRIGEFAFDDGALVVFFNDHASIASVELVARRVRFGNLRTEINQDDRFVRFKIVDSEERQATAIRRITIGETTISPIVEFSDGATEFVVGSEPVQVDSRVEIGDADSEHFGGGRLVASFVEQSQRLGDFLSLRASERIRIDGQLLFEVREEQLVRVAEFGVADGTLVVELNDNASMATVQAIARRIVFGNEGEATSLDDRFVQFRVTDADALDGTDVRRIEITGQNAAPVVTFSDGHTEYVIGSETVFVDSRVEIADSDSEHFGGGRLVTSFVQQSRRGGDFLGLRSSERISIDGQNVFEIREEISVRVGEFEVSEGMLIIHFNDAASVATVQRVARQIVFGNEHSESSLDDRYVRFSVIDADGEEGADVRRIKVDAVNVAPVIEFSEGASEFVRGGEAVAVDQRVEIGDADSDHFGGGRLVATFVEQSRRESDVLRLQSSDAMQIGGNGVFEMRDSGLVRIASFGFGVGELTIEFNENASVASVQQVARQIVFENRQTEISGDDRYVRFRIIDGDGDEASDVRRIEVSLRRDDDGDGADDDVEREAPFDGDGNQDGIPDDQQDRVASIRAEGDRFVTLSASENTSLLDVQLAEMPNQTPSPEGTTFPVGLVDFRIDGVQSAEATIVTLYLEPGMRANAFYVFGPTPDDPNPHWFPFVYDGETGAKIFGDRIELHYVDGKRGDSDLSENGVISDPGGPAIAENPWQNPTGRGDVNHDGEVTPLDALLVINHLAQFPAHALPQFVAAGEQLAERFWDVSGDEMVSPLDALHVINLLAAELNRAESESITLDDEHSDQWMEELVDEAVGQLF